MTRDSAHRRDARPGKVARMPRTSFHSWARCAALVLLFSSGAVAACESALFSCQTERTGKIVEICATPSESGGWSGAQYRYGPENAPELVYPSDPSTGPKSMYFSHEKRAGEYRVSVRFRIGGYVYRVFSNSQGQHEGTAGVSVSSRDGKILSTVRCGERPLMFSTYLREALACDNENSHGRSACREQPFETP